MSGDTRPCFDRYPNSRDVEYAAIQLGKIHLARGEPVAACEYFNWFLDHTHANNGQVADICRILASEILERFLYLLVIAGA